MRFAAAELEARLEESLEPVLSSRRTAQPLAAKLAPLTREQQDFALHWVRVMARTSGELAYQFAALAPAVLPVADNATAERWIIHAMDTFDREGLYRSSEELKNVDAFVLAARSHAHTVGFEDASRVLALFICGLAGRPLKLEAGSEAYTDTENIHLPARIGSGETREKNFLLYKALTTHLWAQTRYGTFNVEPAKKLAAYQDPERALALYNYFETIRIDAIISRDLPGLARELTALRADTQAPPECARLMELDATAADSLALVEKLHTAFEPPQLSYMGVLHPEVAETVRASRIAREKEELITALSELLSEKAGPAPVDGGDAPRYSIAGGAGGSPELMLDGMPVESPARVKDLLSSLAHDLGEVPAEYLDVTDGDYRRERAPDEQTPAAPAAPATIPEEGTLFYNEWDYNRRHYRKNWCVLREVDIEPGSADFIDTTLERYALQVRQLRRTFEMLRGEEKQLKKQPAGDDIDFDAVITAFADLRSGRELPEQLFRRRLKTERDVAVMFMVDMSGSTKGWINDAERESLVMLCEALEVLGDRYAIYGFSGITRKRCEIYRIKRFNEAYDQTVRKRIAGIRPQDYTRMGVAIRHLAALLNAVDARTKLLITLSDGKPDDYSDNYRGEYGIEDTRQALVEAKRRGIHSFCITIDREAREYLPRMYGAVNYAVIEDVARLPLKVADVYRRIST